MRFPSIYYQMQEEITERFPQLRPAQQAWLTLFVFGSIQAKSATQSDVVAALLPWGKEETLRQYLREGLYDGKDRAAPCSTEIDVKACFPFLLAWILSLWQGDRLPLALDATLLNDDLVSLSISLLYRGNGLPIAWTILPANTKGEWKSHLLSMLSILSSVIPKRLTVVVMTDRGLWCPDFWRALTQAGWHPLMRLHEGITFRPHGRDYRTALEWVGGSGRAFLASGTVFKKRSRQLSATLVVSWEEGEKEPWVLLTDLPPDPSILRWYGLRYWIEAGFRSLKGMGWQWQRTRRRDPKRVERHWLVMALAQLWTLAVGTQAEEDAPKPRSTTKGPPGDRTVSVFRRGLAHLHAQFLSGHLGKRLRLIPERWPDPPWFLAKHIVILT